LEKLYGKSNFYAGDPFHEGGNFDKIDIKKTGVKIYESMPKNSTWVI